MYSVVGLVLPRGEEQISGPSALSKLKKTSKRSQKGPRSCQKYSKLCYDHFGGRLEASNPPPLFTLSQSEGYWTVSSFFLLHRISFHQAHSISHFFGKSYFCWTESWTHGRSMAELMHSIHSTPAVYDCCFFWLHWISFHQAHNISHFSFLVHLIFQKDNNSNF